MLCYLAVRRLRVNGTDAFLKLNITPSALNKAIMQVKSMLSQTGSEKALVGILKYNGCGKELWEKWP
jgi:hypothetical protein